MQDHYGGEYPMPSQSVPAQRNPWQVHSSILTQYLKCQQHNILVRAAALNPMPSHSVQLQKY